MAYTVIFLFVSFLMLEWRLSQIIESNPAMTDEKERIQRDFYARDAEEQAAFLHNTWCNTCQQVDLGMVEPQEYEFLERIFIEGKCTKCGEITITEVVEGDEDDEV